MAASQPSRRVTDAQSCTVRGLLLRLVAACLLPAVAVSGVALVAAYREGRALLAERADEVAAAALQSVDAEVARWTSAVDALATSPALTVGDAEGFQAQLRRAVRPETGVQVILLDAPGQRLADGPQASEERPGPDADQAWMRRALGPGELLVSDLRIDAASRQGRVRIAAPVSGASGERRPGWLALDVPAARIVAPLAERLPAPGWSTVVYDRRGTVVARLPLGTGGPAAAAASATGAGGDTVQAQTAAGGAVPLASARSPVTGWSVAVSAPEHALQAPLRRWLVGLGVGSVALFALGAVIAGRIGRRIAAPIAALVEPARALGRGETVSLALLPLAEADQVGMALTRTSRLLQARTLERDAAMRAWDWLSGEAERLAHAAHHDPLTGVANRAGFLAELEQRLQARRADARPLVVFYIDVDDFKPVNDRHGHGVGDALLRDFAARLVQGVRERDVVGRLGGDEFAVLLDGLTPQQAGAIADALIACLSKPYVVRGVELRISACIGIAGCVGAGADPDALLDAADAAMLVAKASGKRHWTISDAAAL